MAEESPGSRPVPDPTLLTTQQLNHEIAGIQALFTSELSALRELHAEKFASVEKQFLERDTRTEQTQRDSNKAIDAALQAAKEDVAKQNANVTATIEKTERATTKQIDQQADLIRATADAASTQVGDVKERVTRLESFGIGSTTAATKSDVSAHNSNTLVVAVMAVIVSAIGVIGVILDFATRK